MTYFDYHNDLLELNFGPKMSQKLKQWCICTLSVSFVANTLLGYSNPSKLLVTLVIINFNFETLLYAKTINRTTLIS